MYYDVGGRPKPGSLLESVLLIISNRRLEARFLESVSTIKAILKEETLTDTLRLYSDTLFPYLEGKKKRQNEDTRKALKQWTDQRVLSVKPLQTSDGNRAVASRLRKGAEKVRKSEEERRQRGHWRIG